MEVELEVDESRGMAIELRDGFFVGIGGGTGLRSTCGGGSLDEAVEGGRR